MQYNEIKIKVDKENLDWLQAELAGNGYVSMMIDDPADVQDILDHPDTYRYDYINEEITRDMTRKPEITLYFEDTEEGRKELGAALGLLHTLDDQLKICGSGLSCETAAAGDDSEWLYKWQEYFKPTRVGERIVVKPSWEEYEAGPEELVIEMDPGMAFGSGLHETTSMCIKALEKILNGQGAKVLDVGCGTGILAIAAALLGADECLGIDIDPDAVRVASENIDKNGLSDRITAQYGDLTEGVDYKADIIVANLMADLVIRLTPAALRHLDKGGWYITSGILDIKEEIVCKEIRAAGFEICEVLSEGEWRAVIAVRP